MEVLKEMGTDQVTGQEAMLFMLMDRMERLEQKLEERADREASTREELAACDTRLKCQEETFSALKEEMQYIQYTNPWLRPNPNFPLDVITGFLVGAAGCLLVLTAERLRWRI